VVNFASVKLDAAKTDRRYPHHYDAGAAAEAIAAARLPWVLPGT
jgi:hypothetical protein